MTGMDVMFLLTYVCCILFAILTGNRIMKKNYKEYLEEKEKK